MSPFFVLLSETPWSILGNDGGLAIPSGLDLASLGTVLRRGCIGLCFVALAVNLVKLYILHDTKNRSEIKQNIVHKVWIIIICASLILLFTLLKETLDSVFGLG